VDCTRKNRMPIHDILNQTIGNSCIELHVLLLLSTDSSPYQTLFLRCFNTVTQQDITQWIKSKWLWLCFGWWNSSAGKSCCSIMYCRTRVIPVPLFPLGNSLTAHIKEKMPIPTKKGNSKYILETQDFFNVKVTWAF